MAIGAPCRFVPGEPADDDGLAGGGEGGGVDRRRKAGDKASPRRRVDIVCPSELLLPVDDRSGDQSRQHWEDEVERGSRGPTWKLRLERKSSASCVADGASTAAANA